MSKATVQGTIGARNRFFVRTDLVKRVNILICELISTYHGIQSLLLIRKMSSYWFNLRKEFRFPLSLTQFPKVAPFLPLFLSSLWNWDSWHIVWDSLRRRLYQQRRKQWIPSVSGIALKEVWADEFIPQNPDANHRAVSSTRYWSVSNDSPIIYLRIRSRTNDLDSIRRIRNVQQMILQD